MFYRITAWLKWFIDNCLSDSGAISFGRTMSGIITLYFLGQDAWFFHRIGHLVDNSTLLTQLGLMTAFYGVNKVAALKTTTPPALPQV